MRMSFRKVQDQTNKDGSCTGFKYISDTRISFPSSQIESAIIEEVHYLGINDPQARIIIADRSFDVEMTPELKIFID